MRRPDPPTQLAFPFRPASGAADCAHSAWPIAFEWRGPHLGMFCGHCRAFLTWTRQTPASLRRAPRRPR